MRTSINVVGDSFGAGIVDHLSKAELAELDAAELLLLHPEELDYEPPPPLLTEGEEPEEPEEPPGPLDPFRPPELPPRSPRPPKLNHHPLSQSLSQSTAYSPARSARSARSPSPRSVCSHSPRPGRTHSPRLLRRTEAGYCALPSHDNQIPTMHRSHRERERERERLRLESETEEEEERERAFGETSDGEESDDTAYDRRHGLPPGDLPAAVTPRPVALASLVSRYGEMKPSGSRRETEVLVPQRSLTSRGGIAHHRQSRTCREQCGTCRAQCNM
ncbi:Excitatory amino acid transporter 2 [Liparis tanakae]|uniref:Excitatory amino acid transporter 2 n=1 Tax=Liparis tanakae TaxID=230148 RepID=A0A4Z2ENG5_9TELE|nr:Excitatory amino acid transporter 2 [Liparis tanakae]